MVSTSFLYYIEFVGLTLSIIVFPFFKHLLLLPAVFQLIFFCDRHSHLGVLLMGYLLISPYYLVLFLLYYVILELWISLFMCSGWNKDGFN